MPLSLIHTTDTKCLAQGPGYHLIWKSKMDRLTRAGLAVTVLVYLNSGLVDAIHAAILAIERQALIALYNSANGDYWLNNSG